MRRLSWAWITCVLIVVASCGPPPRGSNGGGDDDGNGTMDASQNTNGCAMGTELIYVIDQFANKLSTFDPATKQFQDLGSLSCGAMGSATPFSMSVDRSANAWVLYSSGELFKVALGAGLACTKTTWSSPSGLKVFGMGFSTDAPGSSAESLYIGGGASQTQSTFTLAKVDTSTMTAMPIGNQTSLPEMTGTGNAELWGFMPDATTSRVVQFDKGNGTALKTFMEPMLAGSMSGYAFAHWGGDYWVFLMKSGETSTKVYQIDGGTGVIKTLTPTSGRTIVGAGVSTCAPVVIL